LNEYRESHRFENGKIVFGDETSMIEAFFKKSYGLEDSS
jgi:hypothetical protein